MKIVNCFHIHGSHDVSVCLGFQLKVAPLGPQPQGCTRLVFSEGGGRSF